MFLHEYVLISLFNFACITVLRGLELWGWVYTLDELKVSRWDIIKAVAHVDVAIPYVIIHEP